MVRSRGARSGGRECLVEHLDESCALVRVRLTFVQLHELLDLLADRFLNHSRIRRDYVATLRTGFKESLRNRNGNLVGLRELARVQVR